MYKKKLRKLSLFSLGKKRKLQGRSYCWLHLSDWRIQRRPRDFREVHGDRMRGCGYQLQHGEFKLNVRKFFFTMRVVTTLAQEPAEDVESLSLEIFSPLLI